MSKSKAKGTAMEVLVQQGFAKALNDDRIMRSPLMGKNDVGDIANVRTPAGGKVAIEVKNVAKMNLAGWVTEAEAERENLGAVAGIVIHKRVGRGQFLDQYVTLTVKDLLALVWGIGDE